MAPTNKNAPPVTTFDAVLERKKKLPAESVRWMDEMEDEWRKDAESDGLVAERQELFCRQYLASKKTSATLRRKMVEWREEEAAREKQELEKKLESEKEEIEDEVVKPLPCLIYIHLHHCHHRNSEANLATVQIVPEMTAPPVMATASSTASVNTYPGCHPTCGSHHFHPYQPCPVMAKANKEEKKRAAAEDWEKKKAAKKAKGGPHVPLVGDWKCRCGFWNSKYWYQMPERILERTCY
jgi:hypothetical protein